MMTTSQSLRSRLRRQGKSLVAALFLAFVCTSPLWYGAGAALAVQSQASAATAAPVQVPKEAEPGYGTPRETLASFLRDVVQWREHGDNNSLKRAIRALDLSAIPSIDRAYNGERYATRLIDLVDKVAAIDAAKLQDDPMGLAAGTVAHRFARADMPDVAIELVFTRVNGGEWLIANSTLQRIDGWTRRYDDVPPLSDSAKLPTLQEWVRSTVPAALKQRIAFLQAWQWIGFGILILAGILAQRIVSFFFKRFMAHVASSDRIALDTKLLNGVARPIALLATSIAFFAGVPLLDLNQSAYHVVNIGANVAMTIAVVWTAYRLVDVLAWRMAQKAALTETKFDDMLVPLMRRTLKFVVVIIGGVLIVTRLNSDLWGLVAGLSIGSLAVGFAAKDSIENLFGTFTVLMDKPFQLGDLIMVNGIEGTVEDVGFRSTRLRTAEDSLITVPNSRFIAADLENRGLRRYRRVSTSLGVTCDTPPAKIEAFCEGIRELIRRHPYTRKADYHVWMKGFGASSLDLELTVFLDVSTWAMHSRERHRLYLDILRLAERSKVRFAFPTQTVKLEQVQPAADEVGESLPDEIQVAVERGRRMAAQIADDSLREYAGQPPAEVRFDTDHADDAGHGRFQP